ncbi:MAG TPA: ABC transporter substrate-binding protein [Gaiellaceae bacterium]|nr:ABC transporter substrate-binding protein [Gaiellaceae bacterium]
MSLRRPRLLASSVLVAVATGALAVTAASGAVATKHKPVAKHAKQIALLRVGFNGSGNVPTIGITHNVNGSSGIWLAQLGQEHAFHLTADGKMHPWLSTGYRRLGANGWAYSIRKGVKFFDGNTMTSKDVAASWNFYCFGDMDGLQPGGKVAGFCSSVKSITAPSKWVVLVTMKNADATWRTQVSQYYFGISERSWMTAHDKTMGEPGTLFMGTGPYMPTNFNPTSGVDFVANPHYWNAKKFPPPFKKIHIAFYSDEQGLALAARAGDYDIALSVGSPKTFKATSGGWKVTTAATCGVGLLSMPTQTAPFNDIHVRRAIAYALNKGDIVKALAGGAMAPEDYMVVPSLLQLLGSKAQVAKLLKSVPTYKYSVAKAKQELAKSSVPNGFDAEMIEANDPITLNVSQVIAAQLKKIGINVKITGLSTAAWFGVILGPPDKRPFLYSGTGACQPDPNWEPSLFLGTGQILNIANYNPASMDNLLKDAKVQLKPLDRLKTYVKIDKQVNTDLPYAVLYSEGTSFASNKYKWTGYGAYWLDEPWALFLKPTGK